MGMEGDDADTSEEGRGRGAASDAGEGEEVEEEREIGRKRALHEEVDESVREKRKRGNDSARLFTFRKRRKNEANGEC